MMRVSRYIYIIGVAALALQGCNKDSHPSTPDMADYAISMSASKVVDGTRALIEDVADLQNIGFKVYGYKTDKAGKQQVFAGEEVTYGATNGWQYSPIRYWDRMANYKFAAYAPATLPTYVQVTHTTGANQTLGITVPNWQAIDGTETDIIVATSQGEAADYLDLHNGTVKLDFAHILAQLEVQIVCNALLTNEYKLTALTYSTVPTGDGKATYTLDYTTPNNSAMGTVATGDMVVYSNTTGVVVEPEVKNETTFKHLVVPFSPTTEGGLNIVVDYTVNGTPRQATVKAGVVDFEAGNRYVLKLTFNSGAEIIPKLQILDWEDVDVDEEDKYNW